MRATKEMLENFPTNELFISGVGKIKHLFEEKTKDGETYLNGLFELDGLNKQGKKNIIPIAVYKKIQIENIKQKFKEKEKTIEIVCTYSKRFKKEGDKYINLEGRFVIIHAFDYDDILWN